MPQNQGQKMKKFKQDDPLFQEYLKEWNLLFKERLDRAERLSKSQASADRTEQPTSPETTR